MNISFEEVMKAVEYTARSPFVGKTRDVGDDLSLAEEINESSAVLGTVKREHENALSVLSEAAKDPEPYLKSMSENADRELLELTTQLEQAKQNYDDLPKRDEEFIASCEQEIEMIEARRETKKTEIRTNYQRRFEVDTEKWNKQVKKNSRWWGILFLTITLILSTASINMELFLILAMIVGPMIILSLVKHKPQPPSAKPLLSAYKTAIQRDTAKVIQDVDREIAAIREKIEAGYSAQTEFGERIVKAALEVKRKENALDRMEAEIADRKELTDDGFRNGISLLEKALENFEPLNNWAANYLMSREQAQHNLNMARIEQQKLQAQREADAAVARAMREQSELLEKQAAAAAEQARAAEQQAKDMEEIRKRMENERYGDYPKKIKFDD